MKKRKIKKPFESGHVKVPIVMQLEELECGAACLAMVMAYYQKWVPLEQVRIDCGVSRNGSKASNIVAAGKKYGLNIKGYRFEVSDVLESATFPCIIHWNFNHFVVLNGIKGDKIYLNDPARGSYTVTMDQFIKAFTGVCLLIEPSDEFIPDGKQKSTLAFARKRLQGNGSIIIFVVATLLITSLMGLISPTFSRIFIDRILSGQNPEWFTAFTIGFVLFNIVGLTIGWIKTIFSYKLGGKLAAVADFKFFWHVLRLPMTFFSQRMSGDIMMRQASNTGIVNTLIGTVTPLIFDTAMMIFYLVVILRYSVLLTTVGMFSIAIDMIIAHMLSSRRVNVSRVQARDSGKLSSETLAGIEMIETIKASGAENGFLEKLAGYQASLNAQDVKVSVLESYIGLIPSFVSTITGTAILIIGVYLTIQGKFTVGMILAFQGFLSSFRSPINSLIKAGQTIQEMRTNMERVEDVLQYETDVNYSTKFDENKNYDKLSGQLTLRNVSFTYSALDEPIIEEFNLELESGRSVAFVGYSGCGKSTLSKLISGLYPQCGGEILFDGMPISSIDHTVFTSSVAVVDQDITLFADTFCENIRMWDSTIENFEVIMAARDAGMHETITEREGGYSSILKEGGKDLSGGQRQRLEIARALAQDPTLIILDEATSALDSKTEFEVVRSIKNRGITCIVIAHRLSAVRNCDEIIVLDKGKIVERGTHEQLYAQGGIYTALVSNE